jgi:hypothetical protein
VTPAFIIAAASAEHWRPNEPRVLPVMDLGPDDKGGERRLIVQLVPPPFSQGGLATSAHSLARFGGLGRASIGSSTIGSRYRIVGRTTAPLEL